ncbi:MAG: hypothetical protein OHK003_27240 [Anaerolineales bacterium]
MQTPANILKETFGYDAFRPLQKEIIENGLAVNYDDLKVLRLMYLTVVTGNRTT